MQHKAPPQPLRPIEFAIVISEWVEVRRRVSLRTITDHLIGTLADAKASLAGKLFYAAKIYDRGELVATVRGTQTKQNPIS